MAGLLEFIGGMRGKVAGYRDATRAEILGPVLDRLDAAKAAEREARLVGALRGSTGKAGVLSQFGPGVAGQLGPLLTSDDPQLKTLGTGLLGQLLTAKAAPQGLSFDEKMLTPDQRQGYQQRQSQFEASQAQQQQQYDRSQALDERRTQAYLAAQGAAMRASQLQGQQYSLTGGLDPKEWLAQGDETRALAQAVGAGRGIVKILDEYGTAGKIISPEAQARLQTNLFTMIPALQKALNAGGQNALGTEEREFITEFLGNPAGFNLRDSVTRAKIKFVVDKLDADLTYRAQTRPYLPAQAFNVPSYELPPGLVPLGDVQPKAPRFGTKFGPGFPEDLGWGASR